MNLIQLSNFTILLFCRCLKRNGYKTHLEIVDYVTRDRTSNRKKEIKRRTFIEKKIFFLKKLRLQLEAKEYFSVNTAL